jgi:hypothetical protein
MRTIGLVAAIGIALTFAAPSTFAQNSNPVFNGDSSPRSNDVPTDTPSNGPMNGPRNGPMNGPSSSPSQPPAAAPPPPPPAVHWNSAAAAIWRVHGQVHVAIGYSGVQSSADEARSSAVEACRKAGGSGCKAIGAWNSGCLYITTGRSSNRAGWGSGGDVDTAMKKCRAYGFTCKQPIGGCVD